MAEVNKVMLNIREFGKAVRDVLSSPEASQKWLKDLHDSLLYGIEGVSQFGDALRNEALEYTKKISEIKRKAVNERWQKKIQQNIKQQPQPTKPPTKEEVYAFAEEHQLDDIIAREWLELHQERGFKDKNGKTLINWKGALTRYCKAREDKL